MTTTVRVKNEAAKTRPLANPYEVWQTPYRSKEETWEWRVLKKWQVDDDKPFARWFTAVRSPMTYGGWEYGDTYVKDVKQYAVRVDTDRGGE